MTVLPLPVSNQPHLVVDASLGTGSSPSGVAVSGDKILVTNQAAGTMTVYRKSDNAVLATVNVGGSPSAVVVNSAGTRVYVANSSTGQVNVIDTSTYTPVANVKAGTTPERAGVDAGRYAAVGGQHRVEQRDEDQHRDEYGDDADDQRG